MADDEQKSVADEALDWLRENAAGPDSNAAEKKLPSEHLIPKATELRKKLHEATARFPTNAHAPTREPDDFVGRKVFWENNTLYDYHEENDTDRQSFLSLLYFRRVSPAEAEGLLEQVRSDAVIEWDGHLAIEDHPDRPDSLLTGIFYRGPDDYDLEGPEGQQYEVALSNTPRAVTKVEDVIKNLAEVKSS